jgi:uncharacterized membrane protein (DUF485 family)
MSNYEDNNLVYKFLNNILNFDYSDPSSKFRTFAVIISCAIFMGIFGQALGIGFSGALLGVMVFNAVRVIGEGIKIAVLDVKDMMEKKTGGTENPNVVQSNQFMRSNTNTKVIPQDAKTEEMKNSTNENVNQTPQRNKAP